MKNNINYKKYIFISIFISLILSICFFMFNEMSYKKYSYNYNLEVEKLVTIIKEKNPEFNENELIKELDNTKSDNTFRKYGIDINESSIIAENNKEHLKNSIIAVVLFLVSSLISIIIFVFYSRKKENDINNITKIIKEINKKNYELDINTMSEDELSILKNEIYKTMVNLKETTELSNSDKVNLKKSLEDISHQLKTPLTSILIMLDNLIDNPEIEKDIQNEFLKDIKLETNKINFLVQNILKLSKLDSNTIEFIKSNEKVSKLVNESIKNVDVLIDLKDIKVNKKIINDSIIDMDLVWQKEAITNLIKNAVEHSNNNSEVDIIVDSNNVYSSIKIINYNSEIDKEDLKHIFDRFYKCKNSNKDSIGIGLSLAKTIVESNNGNISVESNKDETIFEVKYYKV